MKYIISSCHTHPQAGVCWGKIFAEMKIRESLKACVENEEAEFGLPTRSIITMCFLGSPPQQERDILSLEHLCSLQCHTRTSSGLI